MFFNVSDVNRFGGDDETMGAIDWNSIINQGFAVGSHAISAFSGQNSGTQVGYNQQQGGVFAIQQTRPNYDDRVGAAPGYSPEQVAAMQRAGGAGSTIGGGVDGIFNWLMANPLITFGGLAGIYLLMREPPRSSRR